MIYSALVIPGGAALLAAAVLGYGFALTFRRKTWRFAGAIILSFIAFVMTAFPTWMYAETMTDTRLHADFIERGKEYGTKTFEEFRGIMLTRWGSTLLIPSVLSVLITGVAFILIRNAKRLIIATRQSESPK